MAQHGVVDKLEGRRPPRMSADLLAVLAVTSWGLSYGLTKLAFREWRPLVFTGTRFLAMAAVALGVLATQRRLGAVLGVDRTRFALGGATSGGASVSRRGASCSSWLELRAACA
jgi:drug/metabolite transporter (DMT)-like permease